MCVIAHGLKKDMLRPEVEQCMKSNNYGFFIGVLKKDPAKNVFVRTLEEKDILKTFDEAEPDDVIVTHSRIPSRGGHGKNLNDVHGWEQDGIRFCHNMTLSCLDDVQREDKCEAMTDSEYFFRHIFIPLWELSGKKWTPYIDKIVKIICGTCNRFLFILPDNTVKMFGTWVKDHKCEFSNSSYKVYPTAAVGWGAGWSQRATWEQSEFPISTSTKTTSSAEVTLNGARLLAEVVGPKSLFALTLRSSLAVAASEYTLARATAKISHNSSGDVLDRIDSLTTATFRALPSTLKYTPLNQAIRTAFHDLGVASAEIRVGLLTPTAQFLYRKFSEALEKWYPKLLTLTGPRALNEYLYLVEDLEENIKFILARYNVLTTASAAAIQDYAKMFKLSIPSSAKAPSISLVPFEKMMGAYMTNLKPAERASCIVGMQAMYEAIKSKDIKLKREEIFATPKPATQAEIVSEEVEMAELNEQAAVLGGTK